MYVSPLTLGPGYPETEYPFQGTSIIGPNLLEQVGRYLHPEIAGSTMSFVCQLLKGDASAFMLPERTYI
jgi:hypothetical protein